MLQREKNSQFCARRCQTKDGSTVQSSRIHPDAAGGAERYGEFRIKTRDKAAPWRNETSYPNLQPCDSRAMTRYFFNTRIGDELILDPEGEELRDPDHAWEIARAMIRELLKTEGARAAF